MRFGIRASLSTPAGEVAWAQDLSGTFSMATLDASGSYGGKPHSSCSLGKATPVSGEGSLENSGSQGLGICLSLFAKVFSTLASTGPCPHFSFPVPLFPKYLVHSSVYPLCPKQGTRTVW